MLLVAEYISNEVCFDQAPGGNRLGSWLDSEKRVGSNERQQSARPLATGRFCDESTSRPANSGALEFGPVRRRSERMLDDRLNDRPMDPLVSLHLLQGRTNENFEADQR